ncbi:MAG: NAD(P)/FAD-dependent oxidoreductase [Candidatus Diapherotrites archaeon]|nr:NAD(P)/FAD-dependent oxidoreductase [Candidatus Diapherotrites archaeon]
MALNCDVLVIGAGVAGSVSALKLAKSGYTVILVEKLKKVGVHSNTKVDITESIGIEDISRELKLGFLGKSQKSKWFAFSKSFLFDSRVHDFFVKRGSEKDSFDVTTAKAAVKAGAKLFLDSQVEKLEFNGDEIESVLVKSRGKKIVVKPKFVIGADGANSHSLSLSGLHEFEEKGVEISAFGVITKNLKLPQKMTHVFFHSELAPGGYFFIANTHKNYGVASVVVNKSRIDRHEKHYFENLVKSNKLLLEVFSGARIVNNFFGSSKSGVLTKKTRGNFLVVGDAARLLDPVFGYGVRPAILSAYLAAESIEKSLKNKDNYLHEYEQNLLEKLGDASSAHFLRKVFDRLDNSDFDHLIESAQHTHKQKHLDAVFEKPHLHRTLLFKTALRNPLKTLKISTKIITARIAML